MELRFCDIRYYKVVCLINSERKRNITELCKETGFTPQHMSIVFNQWSECGLIVREKEGQNTYVELTESGKELFRAYDKWIKLASVAISNRERMVDRRQ
jgi:predicted transcriptional regulator